MTLLLEIYGHQVRVARDALSALRLAWVEPPDVVILEVRLPGMDGWELARRLQEPVAGKRPFCIACTGCYTPADRRRSAEAGIDLHLVKPVEPGRLRSLLRRLQSVLVPADGTWGADGAGEPRLDLHPAVA
jgi:CheY-like chemotaxis protein